MDVEAVKALLERSRTALSADASPATKERLASDLEALATTLFLEWLTGDKRFETMGQQTEFWLSRFYESIFLDEQPNAAQIYERFAIPLPRAGYMARMLRARSQMQWKDAARVELRDRLTERKAASESAKKEGRAHTEEFEVRLSLGATDELRVVYDRLALFGQGTELPRAPRVKSGFGNTRVVVLLAETILLLLPELIKESTT